MSQPSETVDDAKQSKAYENNSELIAINRDLNETGSSYWKEVVEKRIKEKTRIISKVIINHFKRVFLIRMYYLKIHKARKHDKPIEANKANRVIGRFFFPLIKPYDA